MAAVRHTQMYYSEMVSDEEPVPPPAVDTRAPVAELSRRELGELGEDLAAAHLAELGLIVIERNYRSSEGEADIVAIDEDEGLVVLVEVKTRRRSTLDDGTYAEEAVDGEKRRRYRRIAAAYLMDNFPTHAIRFDVIAVTVPDEGAIEIHHVPGAFDWDASR
ncbi:YraN family protein [Collinsella vaginalis]|uniref:YraN family protein n=1 Tax=Collinsella vaginalis TaxID=1870987 RepID=UPI000A26D75B|nr:YraN family protein [Collinsella vaginalis]